MKTHSQCPCCGRNLLNEDVPTIGSPFWRKSCMRVPGHNIVMLTAEGFDDQLSSISLVAKDSPGQIVWISWGLAEKKCWLSSTVDLRREQELPYW